MTCQTAGGEILGIPGRIPDDGRIYLHNQRMGKVVITQPTKIDRNYLYWLFLSSDFNRHLAVTASGTKILHTSPDRIEAYRFHLPPLSEQQSIAHILSSFDDKIELNRQMNKTLEAIAQALFKSWFVDFDPVRARMEGRQPYGMDAETAALFPDSFEDSVLGEIPKGWRVVKFVEVAEITYGYPFRSDRFNTKEGVPIIRIRDLPNHFSPTLTTEPYESCYVVQAGDVLIGMDGEFRSYYWFGEPSLLNQRICRVRPLISDFPQSYLYFVIQGPLAFFEGAQVGTTVIHLGKKELDTVCILYPSYEVLGKFRQITAPMFDKMVVNFSESRTLAAIRDALLPKLLSGEIRVKDAEKFVEANA